MTSPGRQLFFLFIVSIADTSDDSVGAVVVKPYQFRMSEIEGFRYRVTVREFK